MKNISNAYSLAEVLLALTVLGILMVLTLPSLLLTYEKQIYLSGVRDVMNEGNKAFAAFALKDGASGKLSATNLFANNPLVAGNGLAKVYKTVKECSGAAGDCWSKNPKTNIGTVDFNAENSYKFMDVKGKTYSITSYGTNCQTLVATNENAIKYQKFAKGCGTFIVDLDGARGPNTYGRDVFGFIILDNYPAYLYPMGGKFDNINGHWQAAGTCERGGANHSLTCTGRIVEDGWRINYY